MVRLEKPWGEVFDGQEARDFIRRTQPSVVAYVQAETSHRRLTSKGHAICAAAHEAGALAIADCVTSLGGMPVLVDETGIDIAYRRCTQKRIELPSRSFSAYGFAARLGAAAKTHCSSSVFLPRFAVARKLLSRP